MNFEVMEHFCRCAPFLFENPYCTTLLHESSDSEMLIYAYVGVVIANSNALNALNASNAPITPPPKTQKNRRVSFSIPVYYC